MHTGYDNFWMHKNSRLKPVVNLPKNDNYSSALLTDKYKHMKSGGCPSLLSSFIPPQNNAASSHEKDHHRKSHDQSMWSSIYSLSFMPSYTNNLHSQEPFFSHTNNVVYSSPNPHAQEKHDFRPLEMPTGNVNILTMYNTNTGTLANNGLANAKNNNNTKTQIPRIRVKDVFSLNNKSVQSQLELGGHFEIRQQNEPLEHAGHCSRTLESQTQTEYIKYKSANLVESSKSSPHFEHRTAKQTCFNSQEQFQNSCSFYQQNDGSSLGNFEFNGSRKIQSSLSLESFQSSPSASLLSQLLTQESILQGRNAGGRGNAKRGLGGEKLAPIRNLVELHNPDYFDSNCSRSCGLNERAPENGTNLRNVTNVHCDLQKNLPKINEVNLKIRNSTSNIVAKNAPSVTSKSPPLEDINNQKNCFIQISIPYTGEKIFIRLNDCDDTERNSAASLQSFFEQNEKNCAVDRSTHNVNEEVVGVVNSISPPVAQSSFINHHASPEAASIRDSSGNKDDNITHKSCVPAASTSLTSSPINRQEDTINQRPHRQEFDALSNKDGNFFQNSAGAPEIIQQKSAVSSANVNTFGQGIPTSNFTVTPLTLKQESFRPEIESASLKRAQNSPGGKKFHQTIKTEENSENLTARDGELELQPPDVVDESLAKFHVEGCSSATKSTSDSTPVTDSRDHVDQVKTLKNSKGEDIHKSTGEKWGREVSLSTVNYKSSIDRNKLDLLIQYLKKDQDSGGGSSCKERQSCGETASNSYSDSCRSRRKLDKASVVRNKNNSREMISLKSLKGSNFTCKASPVTERSKNLEKTEDGKSSCSKDRVMGEESLDVSKEGMKCNNPCQENESEKDDSCVAETSNEVARLSNQQFQESSEKPVPKDKCAAQDENVAISTVRTFQNFKTHFCVSCNLVSSIESFWINVVSGEVRCLNCFKRTTLKATAKRNVLKSKSSDLDDSSVKPLRKRKSKTEKENKTEEDSAAVGGNNSWGEGGRKRSWKCKGALRKLNGTKENRREELLKMFESANLKGNERNETINCSYPTRRSTSEGKALKTRKLTRNGSSSEELVRRRLSENRTNQCVKDINAKRKRRNSSGEEYFAKRERLSSSIKQGNTSIPKEQYSEDDATEETVEKTHGRRAYRSEEGSKNWTKKGTKAEASSNISDDTGEEFRCHKVSVVEEREQNDLNVRYCTYEERNWIKTLPREVCPACKDLAEGEAVKRSARHETSDKSESQNIWRARRDHQRPKTSKLFRRRNPCAPDASTRISGSNQNGVEYQKRLESTEQPSKRKNLDEDFSPRKVHNVQDFIQRDNAQTTHPSETWEAKASKENYNSQGGNLWNARISAENSGRSDASKEECFLFGEHLRKEAKPRPGEEKVKVKDLWEGLVASQRAKPLKPSRSKARGFVEPPRRRGPQKAFGSRRMSDSSEGPRRKSADEESAFPKARILAHFKGEGRQKSLAAENRGKRKAKEKQGRRYSEKMPRVSPTGADVLGTSTKDEKSRRPDGASGLFRF